MLYLVPTPIGNLKDAESGYETLREQFRPYSVDLVLSQKVRRFGGLHHAYAKHLCLNRRVGNEWQIGLV